jgi:carbamoyltransferase
MYILGLNTFHADASAVLLKDGELIAAAAEERLNRVKHFAGFPAMAVKEVLDLAGIGLADVDHIALNKDNKANLLAKLGFVVSNLGRIAKMARQRLEYRAKAKQSPALLCEALGLSPDKLRARVHSVEHHLCHAASCFLVSGFDRAAIMSIDGFGDFASTLTAVGHGTQIDVLDRTLFPHSLGIVYTMICQFIGYDRYGDEGKVMGLAPYGEPVYEDFFNRLVRLLPGGRFELNLDYFLHHTEGVDYSFNEDGTPTVAPLYTQAMVREFGPPRVRHAELTERDKNLAASLQKCLEKAYFHILNHLYEQTKCEALCLAGGVALNSVANGMVFDETPFRKIYTQAAAGDDGTALGAAYYVHHCVLGKPRSFVMNHAYTGRAYSDAEIKTVLDRYAPSRSEEDLVATCSARPRTRGRGVAGEGADPSQDAGPLTRPPLPRSGGEGIDVQWLPDEELFSETAKAIAKGEIVGWFQGKMEWGPRALGNRSILAHPGLPDMKDILNARIKHREWFRPFAPSILEDRVGDYFERTHESPYMMLVYKTRPEVRDRLCAINHVDNTGRLQTVSREQNSRYYALIEAFERETGLPVVLNTSFNENEPIVCTPDDALECFLRTRMDLLVMGNWVVRRAGSGVSASDSE